MHQLPYPMGTYALSLSTLPSSVSHLLPEILLPLSHPPLCVTPLGERSPSHPSLWHFSHDLQIFKQLKQDSVLLFINQSRHFLNELCLNSCQLLKLLIKVVSLYREWFSSFPRQRSLEKSRQPLRLT